MGLTSNSCPDRHCLAKWPTHFNDSGYGYDKIRSESTAASVILMGAEMIDQEVAMKVARKLKNINPCREIFATFSCRGWGF